jgi:hypothetical protein
MSFSLEIIDYKLKFVGLMRLGKMRDIFDFRNFNISCGSVFNHINGFFDGFAFSGYIQFRAINYLPPLFSRAEFRSYFNFSHALVKEGENYLGKSRLPIAGFLSANKGFINFNNTRQTVPTRTYHSSTQFLQPCPSRSIASQTKDSFGLYWNLKGNDGGADGRDLNLKS